jgi:hypothetical protein
VAQKANPKTTLYSTLVIVKTFSINTSLIMSFRLIAYQSSQSNTTLAVSTPAVVLAKKKGL